MNQGTLADAGALLARGGSVAGLAGDALAFVLSTVAERGRWLVMVDDVDRAERLLRGLRFFHPKPSQIELFPADDNRPYDGFSPDRALARQRLKVLERIDRGRELVVIATARALLQRVPDRDTRLRGTRTLVRGERLEPEALAAWLTDAGYLATGHADMPGHFAVRGDVVDVWPASAKAPVRIDLFDDEIESLRRLDPSTRRPARSIARITLLPAREERLDADALERAAVELGRLVVAQGRGAARRRRVVEELRSGIRFSAVEEYLPVLVPTLAPLEALAGLEPLVVGPDDVIATLRDLEATLLRRYGLLEADERPLVPPSARYVPADDVIALVEASASVHELPTDRAIDLGARPTHELAIRGADLAPVAARLAQLAADELRVGLVAETPARARALQEMLGPHGIHPREVSSPTQLSRGRISLLIGDLPQGFVAPGSGWAFVPISVLFGGPRRRVVQRAHALFEGPVSSMAQLKQGDPVVHRTHGVGLFRGLVRLQLAGGIVQDFVKLEYRGSDHMFLPVSALEQLSRYAPASSDAEITLDRLGGATWTRRKGKVRDNLLSMAQDLLRLYAQRELATRAPCPPIGPRYRAFEARFPYEETPDQAAAISAVLEDLSRPYPMDRLICGDVGFGKTEVAMRAAMRVIEDGRQVAVLCPTTVLAYQHHRSFLERFAGDPAVRIGMLSRFVSASDEAELLRGLADGSVQIVIGTTSILGRRVRLQRLGLLVVDEEHRFGVKQKERLKRMRAEVDLLSMSATPIPRTLQMALSGVREMSVIATPPYARLAVRTSVAQLSEVRVRDAVMAELGRGGQAFVIHNRVETIDRFADRLRGWLPGVRLAVAHGQMEDEALEEVLIQFIDGQIDVLVCTTIVESGIDLPNVNTMLIHRADLFGLAQLHQLRGRVGRSDRRAQCLLLVPEAINADARKRLRVIVDNQRLGSGFSVASADLELRGGGNLLGAAQSGNIDAVGYDTWIQLLDEAVHSARGELDRQQIDPEITAAVEAFLPDDYVRDVSERLSWYKRLSDVQTPDAVDGILDDLEGEFGALPEPTKRLGTLMACRLLCRELGIVSASVLKIRVLLVLHPSSPLSPEVIERVSGRHPKRFFVDGSELSVRFTPREGQRPLMFLRWALAQLARPCEP
ncbi:MAG TPA: transcription-repair coupling factor [Deltaproteobacteria bacterium]|nr:transcription-repair coupling factor [Deltaproteobacteria bacterium]